MLVNLPSSSKVITSITRTVSGPIFALNAMAAALPWDPRIGASSASLAPVAIEDVVSS